MPSPQTQIKVSTFSRSSRNSKSRDLVSYSMTYWSLTCPDTLAGSSLRPFLLTSLCCMTFLVLILNPTPSPDRSLPLNSVDCSISTNVSTVAVGHLEPSSPSSPSTAPETTPTTSSSTSGSSPSASCSSISCFLPCLIFGLRRIVNQECIQL